MNSIEDLKRQIVGEIATALGIDVSCVTDETPLLGSKAALDSMRLVELCLSLEDKALDIGSEFDWTSDHALSRSRSMFRTVGSLIDEFLQQVVTSQKNQSQE